MAHNSARRNRCALVIWSITIKFKECLTRLLPLSRLIMINHCLIIEKQIFGLPCFFEFHEEEPWHQQQFPPWLPIFSEKSSHSSSTKFCLNRIENNISMWTISTYGISQVSTQPIKNIILEEIWIITHIKMTPNLCCPLAITQGM